AWWAACSSCTHQPLNKALHLPAMHEVVAGGPLTVRDYAHAQTKTANGKWHLQAASRGGIDVVLILPSERYVAAVLLGESSSSEPFDSLRAMAVIARTFVLRLPPPKRVAGHLASDVCDSTACQAIKLGNAPKAIREAVHATAGETLWFGHARAQVFFGGSCGGVTESASAVWPTLIKATYLRSVADPYCIRTGHAAWHTEVPLITLKEIAVHEGWRLPQQIVAAQISQRTVSQRARTLMFTGDDNTKYTLSASALRLAVGRSLGWNRLRSDAYDIHMRDGMLVFDGRGHGHGVGLCQQGATQMALQGKSYRDILSFYFPGTTISITRNDGGWKQSSRNGIRLTTTSAVLSTQLNDIAEAWSFAKSHFSIQQPVIPTVTITPTTEMFRQLTGQPGWDMASTSGNTVVLQPLAIILANHTSMQTLLRHEMLHVAIEASASSNAPLWLREGLVEVLAGDTHNTASTLTPEDTERLLRNATSRQESETAHHAAAARVRRLIERYGMSSVRGWLVTGSTPPTA
ncbi:MAG: SpoIID/LytB domain-containing protein, partial [Terriglobus sp.]